MEIDVTLLNNIIYLIKLKSKYKIVFVYFFEIEKRR